MAMGDAPVRIALLGAGPWAHLVYAPLLATGPSTQLVGVWARRPEAAAELSDRHGARAHAGPEGLDALLDAERIDAVVCAVPPAVQADLAVRAAQAGVAVLLEKPLAADVAGAERVVAAIEAAHVLSMVTFTWRYAPVVRAALVRCGAGRPHVGQGRFVSGGLLGGPFATPWRLEQGPLPDLGPHVVDLLDAALGEVVGIRAGGDRLGAVTLDLAHAGGATSQALLCATAPMGATSWSGADVVLEGADGHTTVERIDAGAAVGLDAFTTWRDEAVALVRGRLDPATVLDARHGLRIQRLLDDAGGQLASSAGDADH